MGFKNNAYATLWEMDKENHDIVKLYDKYAIVNISTSKKKTDGTYYTDFSSRVRLVGNAFTKIKDLKLNVKDKIKLLEVESSNRDYSGKPTNYPIYVCYDIEAKDIDAKNVNDIEIIDSTKDSDIRYGDDDLPF